MATDKEGVKFATIVLLALILSYWGICQTYTIDTNKLKVDH